MRRDGLRKESGRTERDREKSDGKRLRNRSSIYGTRK